MYQHRVTVLPFHCNLLPIINYNFPVTLNVTGNLKEGEPKALKKIKINVQLDIQCHGCQIQGHLEFSGN
jgi:hypothetical protein